jgi:pSer/pThr/pTyr-binding forkhead associated (FHA) protein
MRPDVTTTTEPASLQLSYGGDDSLFELLPGNEIQLGSSAESDLVAASESVSPEHATIGVARDGLLWIRDDSSDNGTWVNGDRLPPTHEFLLRDGDVIRFGDDELTVRCTQPGPPPVTVRLSSDGDVAPMRLTPGSETMLGRVEDSLLATVFGELEGVSSNHASMGVTWDGQVFIRDNGSRNGTWVNGDRITPGLKVPLYSGDTLRVGDVESTVTTEPEPAELIWFVSLPDQTRIFKIVVQPGSEVSLGSEASSPLPRLIAELPEVALNHATFGVTPEGRAWIRDNGSPEGIQVDDNRIPPGERVDLSDSARVALGDNGPGFNLRTHLSSERPPARVLLVRGDDEVGLDIPAGTELKLGSDPDSPLAGENGIRPDHARIGVHPEGYVWIRAIGSGATTFVNGVPLADTEPVRLYKSDVVGLGFHEDYAFTSMFGVKVVVFGEGPRLESEPHPVALRMPGLETAEPLRIDPGSHVQMGRAETSPLHELVNGDDSVADNHASIGVHPSGRVWIRDNESTTGTWVRDDRIEEGRKVALRPGDRIRIGQFETTVEFTQPALPDVIHLVDRSQATKQAVEDIALIPPAVYDRIMEHLEASRIGGVTLGNRALADLPGVDGMGPFEDTWTGLYLSAFRRLLVNTGAPDDGNPTVLHEFGHAADDAYGDGIHWLSSTPEFAAVHKAVHQVRRGRGVNQLRRHHRQRNKHYDTPVELFAEGFSAWLQGDEALLAFAYDDAGAAAKLKDYYDRVFGPLE